MTQVLLVGSAVLILLAIILIKWMYDFSKLESVFMWRSLPISIELAEDMIDIAPELVEALSNAIAKWNDIVSIDLFELASGSASRSGVLIRKLLVPTDDPSIHTFMFSTLVSDSSSVLSATIYVDADKVASVIKESEHCVKDIELVLAHELGHVLGLPHDTMRGSIMAMDLGYCINARVYDKLHCIYKVGTSSLGE